MKKIITMFLALLVVFIITIGYILFGKTTCFNEKSKFIFINTTPIDKEAVIDDMAQKHIIGNRFAFGIIANLLGVWEKTKPGKYEVKKGESLFGVLMMLRGNRQAEVRLFINKLRTKQEFAHLVSKYFIHDSATVMQYLSTHYDSTLYGPDPNNINFLPIPDSYSFYYATPLDKIIDKLKEAHDSYWASEERTERAAKKGLTPMQATIIASIVEEETNKSKDRPNIASVYINRFQKGMPLGADPSIKYALQDFTLNRILFNHLKVVSPYNTYINKGLPPAPLCTPSQESIEMVLDAPNTQYLYFVGNPNLDGYLHFSTTFAEHNQYAQLYRKALTAYFERKKSTSPAQSKP